MKTRTRMTSSKHAMFLTIINKYAIYAYTHGPVTGSGPSVKHLKYDLAPYWLSSGSSLPPTPSPLFSQCESHGRLSALAVRKILVLAKLKVANVRVPGSFPSWMAKFRGGWMDGNLVLWRKLFIYFIFWQIFVVQQLTLNHLKMKTEISTFRIVM